MTSGSQRALNMYMFPKCHPNRSTFLYQPMLLEIPVFLERHPEIEDGSWALLTYLRLNLSIYIYIYTYYLWGIGQVT